MGSFSTLGPDVKAHPAAPSALEHAGAGLGWAARAPRAKRAVAEPPLGGGRSAEPTEGERTSLDPTAPQTGLPFHVKRRKKRCCARCDRFEYFNGFCDWHAVGRVPAQVMRWARDRR